MKNHDEALRDIQENIRRKIEEYAKKHNMTYEAAAKKARLKIAGTVIEPVNTEDLQIESKKE